MVKLTADDCFEVHEAWVFEVSRRLRMTYGTVREFSMSNNIDYLNALWFVKGKPVRKEVFKAICGILDFDWERVQQDL